MKKAVVGVLGSVAVFLGCLELAKRSSLESGTPTRAGSLVRSGGAHPGVLSTAAAPKMRSSVRQVPNPELEFDRVPQRLRAQLRQHLKSLGWKPTNTVGRIQIGERPRNGSGAVVKVQNGGIATDDAEMLVWDWADNNPETIEGEIYWHHYASGEEMLIYVQYGIEDTYDPVPLAGGATWTHNDDDQGAGSLGGISNPHMAWQAPGFRLVRQGVGTTCCVSRDMASDLVRGCLSYNTGQVTKNSWLAAGIGATLGAVFGALKGAVAGPETSAAGGLIGAVEGVGAGTLGNWILNFIVAYRNGDLANCTRDTLARTWCQASYPDARSYIYGFPESNWPSQCN